MGIKLKYGFTDDGNWEYIIEGAPYQIKVTQNRGDAYTWCQEQFGRISWVDVAELNRWKSSNARWAYINGKFIFSNKEDYVQFILRYIDYDQNS